MKLGSTRHKKRRWLVMAEYHPLLKSLAEYYGSSNQSCIITDPHYDIIYYTPQIKKLFPHVKTGIDLSLLCGRTLEPMERPYLVMPNFCGRRCLILPIREYGRCLGYLLQFEYSPIVGEDIDIFDHFADFFADMSHEFNSPLNTISSAVTLLRRSKANMDSTFALYLDIIDRNCRQLIRTGSSLINISKIYAYGTQALSYTRIDLVSYLKSICDIASELYDMSRSRLVFTSRTDHLLITSDPFLLEVIFTNLLSNAFRHSGADSTIWTRVDSTHDNAYIEITDNGPGITDLPLDTIFERFSRGKNTESSTMGLGMSIVLKYVCMLDGVIHIDSTPGEGTHILVQLPLGNPAPSTPLSSYPFLYSQSYFGDMMSSPKTCLESIE